MLTFISYFIYLAFGLGALFLVRRFAKEEALYLLSAVLFVLCLFSPDFYIWNFEISMNVVFMPILIYSMIMCYKDNDVRTKNLFFKMLIVLGAVFLVMFVGEIILSCQGFGAISWFGVGSYISLAISLTTAMYVGKVLYGKFPRNNYIFKALFLLIISAIETSIYSMFCKAFLCSFDTIFINMLLSLLFVAGTCFLALLVDDILLPRSFKKAESKDEESKIEEASQVALETKKRESEYNDEPSFERDDKRDDSQDPSEE